MNNISSLKFFREHIEISESSFSAENQEGTDFRVRK